MYFIITFTVVFYGSYESDGLFLREVYGHRSVLRVLIESFTSMECSLFFCVF